MAEADCIRDGIELSENAFHWGKGTHVLVLLGVYFDAFRAKRQQTLFVGAEVSYFLVRMERAQGVRGSFADWIVAWARFVKLAVPSMLLYVFCWLLPIALR